MIAHVTAELSISFPNADRMPEDPAEMDAVAEELAELVRVPGICDAVVRIVKVWAED